MRKKHSVRQMSLQWRFTWMAAAITTISCILLTILIGKSANTRMDEMGTFLVLDQEGETIRQDEIENIEIDRSFYDKIEDSKEDFNIQSLFVMAGIICAAGFVTYLTAGKALKQLEEFSKTVENVQAQNLSAPLEFEDAPVEIRRLSQSFNQMLGRLSETFAAQKQFSANAAHELRTPLAVMQTKIDVFRKSSCFNREDYEEILEILKNQTERLSRIVSELLEMTELHRAEKTDRIFLRELVEEVLCDLEYEAEEKKICLIQNEKTGEFDGNEILIYRAVFNLVENAIKYNRPNGQVTVSVLPEDDKVSVHVRDTGKGIPKEYEEMIFEPFFRVDKSRSRAMGGAGIGLAMVKSIAQLHGGTVYVKNSSPEGSEIVMEIPICESL